MTNPKMEELLGYCQLVALGQQIAKIGKLFDHDEAGRELADDLAQKLTSEGHRGVQELLRPNQQPGPVAKLRRTMTRAGLVEPGTLKRKKKR